MQQNRIQQLNQLADIEHNLREAQRIYDMNKKLYADKVIPQQEFTQSKNTYDYQLRKRALTKQTLKQDSISMRQQIQQMQESVTRMKSNLDLMRKKMGDLTIKAPVAGQITSLNAEIGESKNRGQRIGQKGEFAFDGKTYELSVKKIFTQVTNGQFQVDMEFTKAVPQGIRRGQTLQVRLALSDETQAVLVPKGGFYQKTGGNWIFKVDNNGQKAYKADIRLGRQNPEYYEVLEGLNPGDKVVTSSYESYDDMGELVIQNGN
jgi:HlyD family secretion protein